MSNNDRANVRNLNSDTWANPNTARGHLEKIVEPLISGGAPQELVDEVFDKLEEHIKQEIRYHMR